MIRAVLDANVLVSVLLSPHAAPGRVFLAWREERFRLVVSAPILKEIGRVLRYPRLAGGHGWPEDRIAGLLDDLGRLSIMTPGKLGLGVISADPPDDRYLECAVEGEADFLVSGDAHLLALGAYERMRIVKPAEFLRPLGRPHSG